MKFQITSKQLNIGLSLLGLLCIVFFFSGCGPEVQQQQITAFFERPLANVSLGELVVCLFITALLAR